MAAWEQPPLPGMGNIHRSALAHERKYSRVLQPDQFYHGTNTPGLTRITSPRSRRAGQAMAGQGEENLVFATPHFSAAQEYAQMVHERGNPRSRPTVYKVQATGPVSDGEGKSDDEVESSHPFKVVAEMPWGRD